VLGLFLVLFGWWVTVVYASLALASAMLVGVVWERSGLERYLKPAVAPAGECVSSGAVGEEVAADGFRLRLRLAFSSGWEQFRSALPYLFAGVAAGAVIYGFVPSEWVVTVAGPDNPFAIPVAAAIGAPLYVWPETMLPMGAALLEKGMGIGALIALVVGGAGASIPEVTVLGTVFKARLLLVYVATILAVAVLIGYAFALLF
jgi:uncharacterized membrane protein YraQ (UPF0718 family)